MVVTIELPEELASKIAVPGADLSRLALEALVAESYRAGKLTMEQVRRILGYGTRMQVDQFLSQHNIFDYTVADVAQDRKTLLHLHSEA